MSLQNGQHPPVPQPVLPTITIVMQPRPAGPNGEYYFDVQVGITQMPGGWRTAHHGLCLALGQVLLEVEKQAKSEGLVKPYTQLPGGGHVTG